MGRARVRAAGVTVTCLCPGFTRTEFHERMEVGRGSAPDFMWLDADDLVATALKDHAKGKVFSVPGAQYRSSPPRPAWSPAGSLQRFQSLGQSSGPAALPAQRFTTSGVTRPEAAAVRSATSSRRASSSGWVVLQPRSWSTLPSPW